MPDPQDAWDSVSPACVKQLQNVLSKLELRKKRSSICEEASIHEYDLRNFLSGNSNRPRAKVGIRLLAFLTRQPRDQIPAEVLNDYDEIVKITRATFNIEADDDFFFRYLEKIRALTSSDCRVIAKLTSGNYYAYRLSNKPDIVLRSHVSIKPFNPFDRLPHFVNLARFAPMEQGLGSVMRAEGQILPVNNAYAFVGFIFDSPDRPIGAYKGLNICIVPSADLQSKDRPARGLFASFTHGGGDRYEYGPIALVRTRDEFKPSMVGEIPIARLSVHEPALPLEILKPDLRSIQDGNGLLATCLSLAIFGAS